VPSSTGTYFANSKPKTSGPSPYNTADAVRLWQISLDLTGPEPDRLAVITGSPVTGKSALLSLRISSYTTPLAETGSITVAAGELSLSWLRAPVR
jgi:hypothetical protein